MLCEVVPSEAVLLLEHLLWSRYGGPKVEFQKQNSRVLLSLPGRHVLPRVFIAACLSR